MTTPKQALEAALSFLDELAANAAPGKRQALNPITIGGSAKLYADGLRASIQGEDAVERVARNANRIWFDTEFIEDGKTIDLISIGMVRSDGATYYAETDQWIPGKASQWVKGNVLVHLKGGDAVKPRDVIAREIVDFAGEKPEFWAYYADYDWVALCQLYGTMMQLPDGWPMFCRDIKQRCVDLGNPKLPEQTGVEHHALADALWNKQAWEFLATGLVPDEAAIRADEREKCETGAIHDIAAERKRQREVEGWTLEHDDGHDRGELAAAAACYAVGRCIVEGSVRISERRLTKNLWPWSLKWWKPKGRRRNLVRAATLIVAEIERIDRAAAIRSGGGE